ncbi:hypothetical protein R3P38DRAFT_3179268 [Favolaschia claudopus]|uniref:Uncharacterized protein n=1 Tax=Favolaschia claudopus TaxID=2862362 RepID=A0AAW0CS95_9AGAR
MARAPTSVKGPSKRKSIHYYLLLLAFAFFVVGTAVVRTVTRLSFMVSVTMGLARGGAEFEFIVMVLVIGDTEYSSALSRRVRGGGEEAGSRI